MRFIRDSAEFHGGKSKGPQIRFVRSFQTEEHKRSAFQLSTPHTGQTQQTKTESREDDERSSNATFDLCSSRLKAVQQCVTTEAHAELC